MSDTKRYSQCTRVKVDGDLTPVRSIKCCWTKQERVRKGCILPSSRTARSIAIQMPSCNQISRQVPHVVQGDPQNDSDMVSEPLSQQFSLQEKWTRSICTGDVCPNFFAQVFGHVPLKIQSSKLRIGKNVKVVWLVLHHGVTYCLLLN